MAAPVNPKLDLARNFVLHTNRNIFLTGKAGTGKTTFLHAIKSQTAKRLVVVAPTGVAAINAGGVTIHSFFQLPFGPLVPGAQREARKFGREKINLLRTLDLLVIDEVSMVRADVLDGIDEVLRRFRHRSEPFGGVQLLMIGDMQQLPPVIRDEEWTLLSPHYRSGYFFGSKALQQTPYVSIELTHIYRQSDDRFIDILNGVREKNITTQQLEELNRRHIPDFRPEGEEAYITLSTHNASAQQINSRRLQELTTPLVRFEAAIDGEFPAHAYPGDAELELKVGAQVMFIKNDMSREKRFYNGKLGRITEIAEDVIFVKSPDSADEIAVMPVDWSNHKYSLDPATKEIKADIIGTFRQYPLRLAWAITIHKSQGLTFERAIIDAGAAFAHGQVYVALSRCKTLEGIVLTSPIPLNSLKSESVLDEFHQEVQTKIPSEQELEHSRRTFQENLLTELFAFRQASYALQRARKLVQEHTSSVDAQLVTELERIETILREKVLDVTGRFQGSLAQYFSAGLSPEENPALQERLTKAGGYFKELLWTALLQTLHRLPTDCDNKQVREALLEALRELEKELFVKLACFESCQNGFRALAYLKARNQAELTFKSNIGKLPETEQTASEEIAHPALFKLIVKWRDALAAESDVSGYMVLPRKTIQELVRQLPQTHDDLQAVKGIGKTKARQFGDDLLQLICEWCTANGVTREETPAPVKRPKAEQPERPAKGSTFQVSYDAFKAGKAVADIAAERGLTVSTIESHLGRFIKTGDLSVYDLIPRQKADQIRAYLDEHKPASLSEARSGLGEDVSFSEIRWMFDTLRLAET
ncbi:helix-turn-helix domain-containing protein [Nibrella saemangeumensis]|uniref:Helix-turn-helix domain-containing protein n=1 Tax=Nibrella saemangeumensis TaxID=1084526 RepID=A0ABP8N7R0_9BACT